MSDVEALIAESFTRLYPIPSAADEWGDVLRRAGVGEGRGRRRRRLLPRSSLRLRRALILAMLLLLLVGIAAAAGYLGAGAPRVFLPRSRPGAVPRLEFQRSDVNASILASYTIAVDGTELRRFARNVGTICQSVDGREFAYTSDAAVPSKFFTYVATSGAWPARVTERNDRIVCPFSTRWLVLYRPGPYHRGGSTAGSLIRHDARTGHELVVARGVDNRYALSPDGTKLVYVRRGRETLELLDLETLQQRTLGGMLWGYSYGISASPTAADGRSPFGLRWSPDGTRVAYVVTPRPLQGRLLAPRAPAL